MVKKTIVGSGWVMLRDPKMVPERLRRPIMAQAASIQQVARELTASIDTDSAASKESVLSLYDFNDLVAVALISAWSWDAPVTVESLQDLPGSEYDEIQKLVSPLIGELMPNFEPDPAADSPTEPSAE
jgi:hypothetical protein